MEPSSPIEYWAMGGDVAKVREALAAGHDVNAKAFDGYTALHGACENGFAEIVAILLENGADPTTTSLGNTPRDLALAQGHLHVVEVLDRWDGTSVRADGSGPGPTGDPHPQG